MRNYHLFFRTKNDRVYFNRVVEQIKLRGKFTYVEFVAIASTGFPIGKIYPDDNGVKDTAKEFIRKLEYLKNNIDRDQGLSKKRTYIQEVELLSLKWKHLKQTIFLAIKRAFR